MTEIKDELFAAPIDDLEWYRVPFTQNHHKWLLLWYRSGDREFCFSFVSPKRRRYTFFAEEGRVTGADIAGADNGERIAWYWASWGDKPERMDAVIRLTPTHILSRLHMLLDAIG